MAGLHGVSFPLAASASLRDLAASFGAGTVVFEGLAPLSFIDGRRAIAALGAGLAAVWMLPNVSEVFARFSPVYPEPARRPVRPAWRFLEWSPRMAYAAALGVLLSVCMLWMSASRTSEFLYFQF